MLFCNYFVNFIAYDLKNKYPIYIENIGYFRYFRKYRNIYQPCILVSAVGESQTCDLSITSTMLCRVPSPSG